jgi:hypothetical protein
MKKDDRILPITRWVAAFIVPFLIAAFIILYIFPDNTTELFAWTINPRMTPMLMGSGYIAGAYFFVRSLRAKKWHQIANGFPAVAVFAASMSLATLLHWDRFNHSHPAFYTWLILYATTPFIIFGVWLYNRRTDPGRSSLDTLIPTSLRFLFGGMGAVLLLIGTLLFVLPQNMIPLWPWQLSPLTARVGGGWMIMPAVFAILIALDGRWSAARLPLESLAVSFALLLLALPRAWDNFDPANPMRWVFSGGTALFLLAIGLLYFFMEARRTATA